ncbi:MAG: phage major capsid protein [Elusimicrobia bacterium]|nr:phage major capsid protein [Elusimicrobiota bacterium]
MAVPNTPAGNTFSYYTSAIAATADALHKSGAFVDIISKGTPTLDRLRNKGKISYQGGKQLAINLMYGLDTPVNSYSDLDPLTITRPDGMSEFFAKWAQYHFPVVISGHEMRTNSGKAQIADLLKARFRQGMNSANERLSNDMWDLEGLIATSEVVSSTGNGGKNIMSIPMLLSPSSGMDTGDTREYDLYGIDADLAYWHPQLQNGGGSLTARTYLAGLRALFLNCSKQGAGEPDLAIADYMAYANYIEALDTKMQYTSWDKADMGFRGVECMGAVMYPDRHVPDMDNCKDWDNTPVDGTVFFINSEHMGLGILSGADFKPETPQKPVDQDAIVTNHFFEGQLYVDHRSCHGIMHDIPAALS